MQHNATALGYTALVNADNKIRIGNTDPANIIEGNVAYSFPSDGRFKRYVQENVPGIEFITKLNPITYKYIEDSSENPLIKTGFIAQDVERAAKDLKYDFEGIIHPEGQNGHYGLAYSLFVVPLVKAIQEQQAVIEQLKKDSRARGERIEELKNRITEIFSLQ